MNTANSLNSTSHDIMSASTSDSPVPINNGANLEIKTSSINNNLSMIFNQECFPNNSFRNNCK